MMMTLLLTLVVFLAAVLAMIAGVKITGRELKGSCGGPTCTCAADGKPLLSCDERTDESTITLPVLPGR
jgi:hypothetical protein